MADARKGERVLRIKFEPSRLDAARYYHLVWEDDDPNLNEAVHVSEYDIPKQAIQGAVAEVRPALQKFANGAKITGGKDGSRALPPKKELTLLSALAESGRTLFEALFKGANEEEQQYANEAREWYAQALKDPRPFRIEMRSHPANKRDAGSGFDAIAPWGVVYPAEDVLPQGLELSASEIHENFWALRHRITAFEPKHAGRPLSSTYDGVDLEKMAFRAYIHGDVNLGAEVKQHVSTSPEELEQKPAYLWPSTNHLYYLNRRDPDRNSQTKGDRLHPDAVANLARRGIEEDEPGDGPGGERREQAVLGLIDGTAVLSEENASDWYKAFFKAKWTAFIVVEVDTYDKPALDFLGLEIFLQLGEVGGNMVDALDHVRRREDIRPWGLLYSLFADPALVHLKNPPPADFNQWIRETAATLQKRFAEQGGH